jgi:CSLREA domain-containing protein
VTACDVRATSVLDPSRSDVSRVSVRGTFAVTSGDNTDDGTCNWEHCSLREAIDEANAAPNLDSIYLGDGDASAPPRGAHAARGARPILQSPFTPLPVIMTDMVLIGDGSTNNVVDADASPANPARVFEIMGDIDVVFRGFSITGGVASGTTGGGGILISGGAHLETTDVAVVDNSVVEGPGGGIAITGNGSTAVLDGTVVDGNQTLTAGWPGGGISVAQGASLFMTDSRVTNNVATNGWGGGIRAIAFGTIDLEDTEIAGNRALVNAAGGGGMLIEGAQAVVTTAGLPSPPGAAPARQVPGQGILLMDNVDIRSNTTAGGGGGLRLVTAVNATIVDSSIEQNTAQNAGGASLQNVVAVLESTTIDGNTASDLAGGLRLSGTSVTTINESSISRNDAAASGGGIYMQGSAVLTLGGLDGTTIDDNEAGGAGGGIAMFENTRVTMTTATIRNNESQTNHGGGLLAIGNAIVEATNSAFTGNEAAFDGGGLWVNAGASVLDRVTISGNQAERNGGGIIAQNMTIRSSTISGNTAGNLGGGVAGAQNGPFVLSNSTVSGNQALEGGGIASVGPMTIRNVTVALNLASNDGGGVSAQAGGNINLGNTLLGSNQAAGAPESCAALAGGSFVSNGGNLSQDSSCTALTMLTDKPGVPAGLDAALQNNGGQTHTHALLEGSGAINAGIDVGATTDQRGYNLVGADDIGAFEFGATAPAGG